MMDWRFNLRLSHDLSIVTSFYAGCTAWSSAFFVARARIVHDSTGQSLRWLEHQRRSCLANGRYLVWSGRREKRHGRNDVFPQKALELRRADTASWQPVIGCCSASLRQQPRGTAVLPYASQTYQHDKQRLFVKHCSNSRKGLYKSKYTSVYHHHWSRRSQLSINSTRT